MKISVTDIPQSGLSLAEDIPAQAMDVERPDIHYAAPVHVAVHAARDLNTVCLRIAVRGSFQGECARCLEEVTFPVGKEFETVLPVKGTRVIDIAELVRDELVLDYPARILCRQDCRGICPECGRNRNTAVCRCQSG
ncbi:MAG: DUF177 domain-containing protein [Candidatus Omnitrophica bacterium]|nr:DUF177 domain-containing protein [Candidatus Omnitrophota bacterium]